MARVALVTAQIDSAGDINRPLGINLDQAISLALIPVITAPGFVGYKLQRKILLRRQADAL